jgi:hypothetical protein
MRKLRWKKETDESEETKETKERKDTKAPALSNERAGYTSWDFP